MLKRLLFYAGADRSSIKRIRPKIRKANCTMVCVLSATAALLIGIALRKSFSAPGLEQNRMVYIFGLVLSILILSLSFVARKHDWMVIPLMLLADAVYYSYGIFIGAFTDPGGKTVTFMVILILMSITFIKPPINIISATVFYDVAFIICCTINKTDPILSVDLTDAAIFGVLGMVSGIMINRMKIRGYISEEQLKEISRIDQLTDVRNRNAYEFDLLSIPEKCKKTLAYVYIDVNGLHELNNSKGHEAGDEMLKFVAKQAKRTFAEGYVYRIGGDEFVVFAPDMTDDVEQLVNVLTEGIEKRGYHVAIGYATARFRHYLIEDLVKTAELRMFQDKNKFYKDIAAREARGGH